MLSLPHLSASELVATLARLGFRTERRANGMATMRRSSRSVRVPEAATLSPSLLGAILRAADVDPFEFVCEVEKHFLVIEVDVSGPSRSTFPVMDALSSDRRRRASVQRTADPIVAP